MGAELQLLRLIERNLPNKEIASHLGISEGEVSSRMTRLHQTLGLTRASDNPRLAAAAVDSSTMTAFCRVVNYLAFILGVCSALVALGVEYHLARIAAGACEAVYIYSAMRWVVFRRPAALSGSTACRTPQTGPVPETL